MMVIHSNMDMHAKSSHACILVHIGTADTAPVEGEAFLVNTALWNILLQLTTLTINGLYLFFSHLHSPLTYFTKVYGIMAVFV